MYKHVNIRGPSVIMMTLALRENWLWSAATFSLFERPLQKAGARQQLPTIWEPSLCDRAHKEASFILVYEVEPLFFMSLWVSNVNAAVSGLATSCLSSFSVWTIKEQGLVTL